MDLNRMKQEARQVVETLQLHGFPAFFVGGCVRDQLAGRTIKDMDIATRAKPEEVMAIFPRTVPTGLKHGTVTVLGDEFSYEVTTFRVESGYEDYRRPTEVEFVEDLRADLERRDFTFNAMAMDLEGNVIDPFGGKRDLSDRIVRCVGEPRRRFEEDALRMLRCIRFAAEFGCSIHADTWQALLTHRGLMRHIAMERVGAELERIVGGADPYRGLRLLLESGLTDCLQTDLHIDRSFWASRLRELDSHGSIWSRLADVELRFGFLLLYLQYDARSAKRFMRGLKYSNARSDAAAMMADVHADMIRIGTGHSEKGWKLALLRYGEDAMRRWVTVMSAAVGELDKEQVEKQLIKELGELRCVLEAYEKWTAEMPVRTVRELLLKGNELKMHGIAAGREIGLMLNRLLEEAALGLVPNTNHALLERAKRWKNGGNADAK